MSATDELRRLLDERGERYWDMGTRGIWFGIDGDNHVVEVYEQTDHLLGLEMFDLIPEQAIEATLGRGECRLIPTRDKPRSKAPTLTCSKCGWWTEEIGKAWNYCPSCGRRVAG